jgi:hypothetical protein
LEKAKDHSNGYADPEIFPVHELNNNSNKKTKKYNIKQVKTASFPNQNPTVHSIARANIKITATVKIVV